MQPIGSAYLPNTTGTYEVQEPNFELYILRKEEENSRDKATG